MKENAKSPCKEISIHIPAEIDKRDDSGDSPGQFVSDGVDFKKGCRLPSLHTEFQHESQESLVCKDDQLDQQPYTPKIMKVGFVEKHCNYITQIVKNTI